VLHKISRKNQKKKESEKGLKESPYTLTAPLGLASYDTKMTLTA